MRSGFSWIAGSNFINGFAKFARIIFITSDEILVVVGFTNLNLLVYEISELAVGIPVVVGVTFLGMF